jgi:hemin uptake protein HemP
MPLTTTAPPPSPSLAAVSTDRQAPRPRPATQQTKSRISSQALFAGTDELEIEHGDALYRLRITSLGKLILTK